MRMWIVSLAMLFATVKSFKLIQPQRLEMTLKVNRRSFVVSTLGTMAGLLLPAASALAVETLPKCEKGSKNCLTHYWRFPEDMSSAAAGISDIKKVIESYPQNGQNSVDLGGWKLMSEEADILRYEFFSSSDGKWAKFFNGGKPFVDDVSIAVDGDGFASVRSSSRIGESDMGVNLKRLTFIEDALKSEGWNIRLQQNP